MDILLIAGLWLDGSVWDNVAAQLEARGHRAVPITLPGQGDGNTSATLADQVATVVAAVDAAAGRSMVVGHSAACSLAWIAADARAGKISKVALIGGFPSPDGKPYFSGLRRPGRRREAGLRVCRDPGPGRGHSRSDQASRRAPLRRPGGARLPGVHPGPGQGMDRPRRGPRAGGEQQPLVRRYRFRSLADDQRAGRARVHLVAGG